MKRTTNQTDVAAHEPLLLNSRQAAEMLAIGERTLWSLSPSGEIPRVLVRSCIRYDVESSCDRWALAYPDLAARLPSSKTARTDHVVMLGRRLA